MPPPEHHPGNQPPPPKVAALVLAAGSASRMGHRPKCLLERDGTPLIRRLLAALQGAGIAEITVVLGHYAERIAPVLQGCPVTIVRNPAPEAGQVASLRLGLQALPSGVDSVLVALADQPLIEAGDIQDLLAAYEQRPAGTQLVQPVQGGEPGNPVVFSSAVRDAILAADARVGGKQWQAAHPAQVHPWATDNPRYRADVDTPGDLAALARRTGHVLRWPEDLRHAT